VGLLTPQQLADQWQVSLPTVYRLVREEGLPVVRLHSKADIRIDPEDAAAWLEGRKVASNNPPRLAAI
jgi:excisionase family DNA binding protein